jgi:FAD/FMN-containing dehydrogenase
VSGAGAVPLAPPPGFRGAFRTDDAARAVYAEAAGIVRIVPAAVAVPADADDVARLVAWAGREGATLVPRGSGSSMAGGAIGPGVVVDLSALREIGPVDPETRRVRVGAGAVCGDVNAAAAPVGLRFPVDPSSAAFCTVGGMAAANAAGARTLRFGDARRWVHALDCVFDDGARATVTRGAPPPRDVAAVARFEREVAPWLRDQERAAPAVHATRKDSSGYATALWAQGGELVDLLCGSEGTLALFVALELRLARRPAATSSVLGAFPALEQAVEAAVRARDAGAVACELLDRTFLDVARQGALAVAIPDGCEAVLLAEAEGDDAAHAASLGGAIERAFRAQGATGVRLALDAASPILARLDPSLRSMQFIEDGAVPPARLPEYVRGVRAALARAGMRGVIFGHAGDAHVHVNPLVDVRLPDWRARVERVLDEVTALVASLGGTLAGEHGDGRLRAPLLDRVWPPAAIERFARVKRAFDPMGILNPGVKVPLAGARPLDAIKYDPSLAAPPAEAARVLAMVERERAYARPRLAMLDEARASLPGIESAR